MNAVVDSCFVHKLQGIPDLLALHKSYPERYPHLLCSTDRASDSSQYDILMAFPSGTLTLTQNNLFYRGCDRPLSTTSFLDEFNHWWSSQTTTDKSSADLPFTGGWFMYVAYELAAEIEPGLNLPPAKDGLPVAYACRIPSAIIVDRNKQTACVVCETIKEDQQPDIVNHIINDIESVYSSTGGDDTDIIINEFTEDGTKSYFGKVEKVKKYIYEGDVFQVNLSRAWSGDVEYSATNTDIFSALKKSNPGPFSALCTIDGVHIISSSPERLVKVHDRCIETRPIAGTRPRSSRNDLDEKYVKDLFANPKERAEHIMLIDLERNDLGRVCLAGSVQVNEFMVLESFSHVHHIVSNVQGELAPGIAPGDVIRAVFPGGTITGCPKVRCMEILAELEDTGRGAYTGSVGYINRNGDMDMNILIRTMVMQGKRISFRAGGGIVADSNAKRELEETRAKAKGMVGAFKKEKESCLTH